MSFLERLAEIFPAIDENFLKGLCDVYKDELVEFEEYVDVVLSYEHPPLKVVSHNESQTELPTNNDVVDQVPENLPLETIDDSQLKNVVVTAVNVSNDVDKVNEVLVKTSSSDVHTTNDVRDIPLLEAGDNVVKNGFELSLEPESVEASNAVVVNTNISQIQANHENSFESLLEDKSTEELDFVVINENINKRTHEKLDLSINSDCENYKCPEVFENTLNNLSACSVTKSVLEVEPKSSSESKGLQDKNVINSRKVKTKCSRDTLEDAQFDEACCSAMAYQESRESYSSSDCSDFKIWSMKGQIRKSSCSLRTRRSSIAGSSRKVTLRCSKIRNEEYRLKAKLLRPKRLSMGKKTAEDNCVTTENSPSQFESPDNRFSLLSKVLPDADFEYLNNQSQIIKGQEELLVFISQALDNRNYPKAKYKLNKTVKMERFDCTVDEFLQEIPDPDLQFSSDYYIRTGYEGNAEIYLKTRYCSLSSDFIKELLANNKYNMTKICQQLDVEGQEVSAYCLENMVLHHPASVFFHHEVWYIEHKHDIQNMLEGAIIAAQVEAELNRTPTPPPVAEVFECEICSDEVDYADLGTCDGPSGHLFCKSCIRRNTEIKIGEGATTFPCLNNCGGVVPMQMIEDVLPAQTFAILMNKIQEEQVRSANIPGIESCPFCPYAYGPDEHLFVCSNPACAKISCRLCKKEDHSPDICQLLKEENEETARHFIEDKMTEALVRVCYKCGKQFVKDDGCNKMTCSCGAMMCYLCRQPVKDYTHFNGQGGEHTDRCELYSDEATVHLRPVEVSAHEALNQLIANNPEMQLDPKKVLPK